MLRKSWLLVCLCVAMWMMGAVSVSAEEHQQIKSDMKLELNGKPLQLDESYLIDNSLFVPYRWFAEGIGAEVSYEASSQKVTVQKNGLTVQLTIGSSEALVGGSIHKMVGPAQLINNSTFVHSRFLSEVFGIKVQYDEATRTVHLVSNIEQSSEKPASKTYYVTIEGFQFKGGNITVEAGSTIVFTNKDKVKHNAAAENGSFKTPFLATGESGSITLTEPGDYAYYCELHKNAMQGTITVK
ncbi:stalk domain-containing protein [Paenibacillus chondroitinus]|uniref:Stalk domain-containing protein n=1 Tax=Paenibacillus chondroitinus TaxID=59842 RepID=A0ABU6D876_9BACL|nr:MULTISPECIES: stalk domain-containing protein [Paenibacillus]MCY9661828.1 stalk domain-containing protein [Paenibacillus anseongense]MEB4793914.1 stalk domain-containing protein [Paenibacillus chondroitinus]